MYKTDNSLAYSPGLSYLSASTPTRQMLSNQSAGSLGVNAIGNPAIEG